ncbi:MAG TPA: adenylate/guanylate cyclase domain-containing protein [Actinomycetota bacterium]|nr:adenylate/guanylate cyclase domain-containing protein [Actinomycetota bacterium]
MSQPADDSVLDRAREAMDRKAWDEAYGLLSEADHSRRLDQDALATLADTAYLAGHPEEAIDAWERVHAAAVRAGEDERGAGAAEQVAALLLYTGLLAPARGWIQRAESLLVDHPDSPVHGQLAVIHAWTAVLAGDLDQGLLQARRAIDVGTRLGVPAIRIKGRNAEARILIFLGHLQEGLAVLDETAVAALSGELDPVSTALLYCSTVCAFQGLAEYDRAEEWTSAMDRWCRRHETGGFHGLCRVHRAEILRLRGDWDDAEVEAREASKELRRYSRTDVGWASAELGQIRLRLGHLAGAEEAFLEAHEQGWDPNPGLALLRLAQGDVAAAAGSIRDSLENPLPIASLEAPPNTALRRAPLLAAEVQIAVAAGDLRNAREAAEDLDRIADSFGTKALRASAVTSMGFLLLAEGDSVEAGRRFHEGMRLWTEVGAPYECAQARMGLGDAFRAHGNERQAVLEFHAAHSTFERLGAKTDIRRAAEAAGDTKPSAGPRIERVFMFTDIVQSTNLAEFIGDEAWGHLVRWHNDLLASVVARHGGEVVRTTGDGFFVTFDDPESAIACAVDIQRALAEHRSEQGFSPTVRIGLHQTEATKEGLDWSGKGVHAAARIGALAEGEEILVSSATAQAAGDSFAVSDSRTVSLKGIFEPCEVVAVHWR